jgi:hypothetical protein
VLEGVHDRVDADEARRPLAGGELASPAGDDDEPQGN